MNYSSTPRIREGYQLITHGIYKYARHPVYSGVLLSALAIPIYATSPLGFLIALMAIPLFSYRMGVEEETLIHEFGDEYIEYKKATWRRGRKATAGISALRRALLPIRLIVQNKKGLTRAHARKTSCGSNEKS